MPIFTPHQDAALTATSNWLKGARRRASIFRLFGYAGTGKTTLAKHLAEDVDGKVLFAAFTGKAAPWQPLLRITHAALPVKAANRTLPSTSSARCLASVVLPVPA